MKTIMMSGLLTVLVISLLCCSKDNDNNPDYYSFIAQDKIWSNGQLAYDFSTNQPYPGRSEYIKIGYDTIISEINWSKVYCSFDKNHENWEDWGFIREDSQKIYSMGYNNEPKLLYDFSLNTGDEIELRYTLTVDSVKYLPILNNEKRKHIFLSIKNSSSSAYVVWIESVGSSSGFFMNTGNIGLIGGSHILLCCEENGIYLYRDSTYDVCYFDSEY